MRPASAAASLIKSVASNFKRHGVAELTFLYAGVPATLLALHFLPSQIKDALVLYIKSPKPWAFLTTNYIHYDLQTHLATNLLAYVLLLSAAIGAETEWRRFLAMAIMALAVAPVASSVWSVAVFGSVSEAPWDLNTLGFSTTVFCLVGYLVFLAACRLRGLPLFVAAFAVLFLPLTAAISLQNPWSGDVMVNTGSHYVSFAIGGFVPFIHEVFARMEDSRAEGWSDTTCPPSRPQARASLACFSRLLNPYSRIGLLAQCPSPT
ncbi:MAG: hypothetical protein QFX35_06985, partial [Candidatus Verstraetearchaeota archaeon]|nr:hypothetical protein [Candidatus Verstraetearchaeota archaeon]